MRLMYRETEIKNNDGMEFYTLRKKGIIPVKDVLSESQRALCGSDLKYALSDFKKRF